MVVASASTEIGSLSTLQRLHDISCTATYLYHRPQFIGHVLNCLYQCVACLICIQMCCISSLVVCMFLLHVLRDSHVEYGMTGLPDVYRLTHEIQQGFQEYRLSNNMHCKHQQSRCPGCSTWCYTGYANVVSQRLHKQVFHIAEQPTHRCTSNVLESDVEDIALALIWCGLHVHQNMPCTALSYSCAMAHRHSLVALLIMMPTTRVTDGKTRQIAGDCLWDYEPEVLHELHDSDQTKYQAAAISAFQ